jgi:transcriptional regulator with XRE-family HTH domain
MPKAPNAVSMHEHVGRRIRDVRQARGLTQTKLGSKLGWTGQVVSFVENGRRQLDVDELLTVSRALGVAAISLLLPVGDDQETRVRLSSGDKLDADAIRDVVMGAGAAEQRRKVADEIRRRQKELNIPLLFDWLRAAGYEEER